MALRGDEYCSEDPFGGTDELDMWSPEDMHADPLLGGDASDNWEMMVT